MKNFCYLCGHSEDGPTRILCKDNECESYHNNDGKHCHDENGFCIEAQNHDSIACEKCETKGEELTTKMINSILKEDPKLFKLLTQSEKDTTTQINGECCRGCCP